MAQLRTDFYPKIERLDITKYAAHSKKVAYQISLAWDRTTYLLLVLAVLDILESDNHFFYFFLYEYDMPYVILITSTQY